MRNFENNAMMQEMILQEMKDVNGGVAIPWGTVIKVAERIGLAIVLTDAGERFMTGWNKAGDSLVY